MEEVNLERRIVITGMGTVSPVGLNCRETFSALTEGKPGVDRVKAFDASDLSSWQDSHQACLLCGVVHLVNAINNCGSFSGRLSTWSITVY
jgi:3-oxoacyl-(acyl-carrier-protein) synthase